MILFNKIPFLRLLIPFLLGILFNSIFFNKFYLPFWILISLLIIVASFAFFRFLSINYKFRWVFGVLLNFLLFSMGANMLTNNIDILKKSHFSNHLTIDSYSQVEVEIIEVPERKKKSIRALVEIRKLQKEGKTITSTGKVIIYFKPNDDSRRLVLGHKLLINLKLNEINEPTNPGVFDYKAYLSAKNIYHQGFVPTGNWILIEEPIAFSIFSLSFKLRDRLLEALKKSGLDGDELAVVAALTLGAKSNLDAALKSSYSKAGVMHVLAVSGLHIGIIFLILNYMFLFIERFKNGSLIKAISIILFLWFYAVLTGLSPSVLRAVTMFSFIAFGSAFNRYTNIYNTLCVSAFFLLLYDPFLLRNVGFQLSYFAVFGIVILYPHLYNFWKLKSWFLDKIWVLVAVSLAAQISTFPLAMYYFHQFPNYFLLSNLVVVPLVTLVIYLSVFTYALSPILFVAVWMGNILSFIVALLNDFVKWIESLPFAVTEGISISLQETILIYLIVGFGFSFLLLFEKKIFRICLILIIVFLTIQIYETNIQTHQKLLIVYDIPRNSAIDLISGTKSLLIGDKDLLNDKNILDFQMKNNWMNLGIDEFNQIEINNFKKNTIEENLIRMDGSTILLLSSLMNFENQKETLKVDYLILSGKNKFDLNAITEKLDIGLFVFDSSVSPYHIQDYMNNCKVLNIPFHSVSKSGCFIVDL